MPSPDIYVNGVKVDHVWLPPPRTALPPPGTTQQHRFCRFVQGDGDPSERELSECHYFVGGIWDRQVRTIVPGQARGEPTTFTVWSDPTTHFIPEPPVAGGVLALVGALLLLYLVKVRG